MMNFTRSLWASATQRSRGRERWSRWGLRTDAGADLDCACLGAPCPAFALCECCAWPACLPASSPACAHPRARHAHGLCLNLVSPLRAVALRCVALTGTDWSVDCLPRHSVGAQSPRERTTCGRAGQTDRQTGRTGATRGATETNGRRSMDRRHNRRDETPGFECYADVVTDISCSSCLPPSPDSRICQPFIILPATPRHAHARLPIVWTLIVSHDSAATTKRRRRRLTHADDAHRLTRSAATYPHHPRTRSSHTSPAHTTRPPV